MDIQARYTLPMPWDDLGDAEQEKWIAFWRLDCARRGWGEVVTHG